MIDVRESTDKLKILIVDDSELNRELLAGMLGDEYEIYQVEDGKKANRYFKRRTENSLNLF